MVLSTDLAWNVPEAQAFPPLNGLQKGIIAVLKRSGPLPRDTLATKLRIPRTTIYDCIHLIDGNLIKRGLVRKQSKGSTGKRGRPKVVYEITAKGSLVA